MDTPQEQEYRRYLKATLRRLISDDVDGSRRQLFSFRHGNICASEAATVLCRSPRVMTEYIKTFGLPESVADYQWGNPYKSRKRYIHEKINRGFSNYPVYTDDDNECNWGLRHEKLALHIYATEIASDMNFKMFNNRIHKEFRWLCATPDGVVYHFPNGKDGKAVLALIEIKCPFRRHIASFPSFMYYVQAQIQMEVFDIPETRFLQFKFKTYKSESEFLNDVLKLNQSKGVCVQYCPQELIQPPSQCTTIAEKLEWAHECKMSAHPDEKVEIVYWKLHDWSDDIVIKRNSKWFETVKRDLYRAHLEIQGVGSNYEYLPDMPAMAMQSSYSTGPGRILTNHVEIETDLCGGSDDNFGNSS